MNLDDVVNSLTERMSASSRETVRKLEATPEAQQMISRVRAEDHALRVKLFAALPTSGEVTKALAAAAKAKHVAAAKVASLKNELAAARDAEMLATGAAIGLEFSETSRIATLMAKLVETADFRLHKLVKICGDLTYRVRGKFASNLVGTSYGEAALVSNHAEISHAIGELTRVADEARGLMVMPLERQAVTARLRAWTLDLASALDALHINAPVLDDNDALLSEPASAQA